MFSCASIFIEINFHKRARKWDISITEVSNPRFKRLNDAFITSRTLHFTRSRISASKLLLSSFYSPDSRFHELWFTVNRQRSRARELAVRPAVEKQTIRPARLASREHRSNANRATRIHAGPRVEKDKDKRTPDLPRRFPDLRGKHLTESYANRVIFQLRMPAWHAW